LSSIDLSNFNTENVKDMNEMFRHCSKLASINLKNFNTNKVTYLGNMFYSCTSLTSIDISNFKTENVKYMDYMFSYCNNLKYIDISSFTTNLQSISLLSNVPSSGKILVKKEFYNKISSQIPSNWEKIFK